MTWRAAAPADATAVAANASESGLRRHAFAPDTAGLTETYAAAARMSPAAQVRDIGAVFHGLFRSRGGPEPVAPLVNSLWTSPQPSARPSPRRLRPRRAGPSRAGGQPAGGELGLFQDQLPDARALFRGRV